MNDEQGENPEPGRGKDREVDGLRAFADLAEQEISRLVEENADLRAALGERESLIVELRAELRKARGTE